jgi:hypothetical protein
VHDIFRSTTIEDPPAVKDVNSSASSSPLSHPQASTRLRKIALRQQQTTVDDMKITDYVCCLHAGFQWCSKAVTSSWTRKHFDVETEVSVVGFPEAVLKC